MTKWTKEQQAAIDFRDESLLVAAAAGSGKTAVLVERIISMVTGADPIDIDRLLVVTFTRAAAAEMRERISLAIAAALGKDPGNKHLVRQLALLNQASITTIDSFCKRVIEENFHLVDLDPNYQISPETELKMLQEEALDEVLEEAYEKGDAAFLMLADAFGGPRDDGDLVKMVEKIWRFSRSGTDPEQWIREASAMYDLGGRLLQDTEWFHYLQREVREIASEATQAARRAVRLIEEDSALAGSKYAPFFLNEYKMLQSIHESLMAEFSHDEARRLAMGMTFERLPIVKAEVSPNVARVKALRKQYKDLMGELTARKGWLCRDEALEVRLIQEMAVPMKALGELTLDFHRRIQAKKLENNRVDFADLEHYALGILREGKDPSEAALKYQELYHEVLIDEYQDSNDVQEAILTAVSREEKNIFMVGDVKQSIYRFRQAKPEIFMSKYKRYLAPGVDESCDGRKILLYRNFRSRPEVLGCVNHIFSNIMTERAGELDYTEEEALIYGASFEEEEGIPVEIRLIASDSPLDTFGEETAELEDLKGIELEARYIAGRIRDDVTWGKTMVNDKGVIRPLHYRDIVILLRATASAAPIFKEALEEAGVPVFSDTGGSYFESIEIRTVMALLRIIDNPLQDIPLLAVLRSPLFSFTEDELISIRTYDRNSLILECLEGLKEEPAVSEGETLTKKKIIDFLDQLEHWREQAVHMPLDEFIWKLYADTAYMEYVGAMPNGYQRQANLRILFQRAGDYERTAFKGLYQFIRYIDAMQERASSDYGDARIMSENEDVVRIMSIHKSKGLEFPVVYLSNTGKRFNRGDQNGDMILHEAMGIAVKHMDAVRGTKEEPLPRLVLKGRLNEESISEEMRVLYVAMTRARERLIITGSVKGLNGQLKKWFLAGEDMDVMGLSPRMILGNASTLDWIMPVVLNSGAIKQQMDAIADGICDMEPSEVELGDGENFDITLISRTDLLEMEDERSEELDEEFFTGEEELTDKKLISILDHRYAHQAATELPSKVSVSVIKKRAIEENMEENAQASIFDETYGSELKEEIPLPAFMKESRELTGADRGTAFHTVMLHVDPFLKTTGEVDQAIQNLVGREILLQEEADVVDPSKVLNFFQTDIGERLKSAAREDRLYLEEVFVREVPARDLVPEWAIEDPVTLIGIIDVFFTEGDDIILLDYKTDAVPKDSVDFLKNRYKTQIDLYAEALEAITGKKVREAYLYSVAREETIQLI